MDADVIGSNGHVVLCKRMGSSCATLDVVESVVLAKI